MDIDMEQFLVVAGLLIFVACLVIGVPKLSARTYAKEMVEAEEFIKKYPGWRIKPVVQVVGLHQLAVVRLENRLFSTTLYFKPYQAKIIQDAYDEGGEEQVKFIAQRLFG